MSEAHEDSSPKEVNDEKNLLTDSTFVIWYGVNHLSSIVIPVGLTMLISTILVNVIRPSDIVGALEEGMTVYMVYKQEADNTWDSIWQAIVNALVIVVFIGLMTFAMVILYKYHCVKVLYALLYFATFSAIGYTGWFVFYMAMIQYRIPWDLISSIVIFVNLGVVSVVCIFGNYAPDGMKKTFLVFISCLVCYLLSFFPDWTTWVLLVAMALYDMCAVLTPCGPLKMLINISRDRDDAIPGLLYETTLDRSDAPIQLIENEEKKKGVSKGTTSNDEAKQSEVSTKSTSASDASKEKPQEIPESDSLGVITDGDYLPSSEIDEEEEGLAINRIFERESVQLGLGDFIFYSLMVSKASLSSTVPFVFVFIIILSGLLITMALLSVLEQALPALPFSMLLGVTTYALSYFLITKMINALLFVVIITAVLDTNRFLIAMSDYSDSTHRNHWIFTKEALSQLRQENHNRIIRSIIIQRKQTNENESLEIPSKQAAISTPNRQQETTVPLTDSPKPAIPSEPSLVEVTVTPEEINKYISVDEERVLLHHFISKLFGIFPRYSYGKMDYRSVQIFAASYVKRFFITRSVLQYNPKTICAAAFLLAIKADDYTPIDADTLGNLFSESASDIISAEQKLMYAIHYEIYVHTPYRTCRVFDAILLELSKTDEYKEILTESVLKQINETADAMIVSLYQTDLDLLCDPSVLSLFVYRSSLQNIQQGEQLFNTCLERIHNWQVKQEQPINLTEIEAKLTQVQEEWNQFKLMLTKVPLKLCNRKWKRQREYDREESTSYSRSTVLSQEKPDSVNSGHTVRSKGSEGEGPRLIEGSIGSSPQVHSEKRSLSCHVS